MTSQSVSRSGPARLACGDAIYLYEGNATDLAGTYEKGREPVDVVVPVADGEPLAPEGIEEHIGHRVEVVGGEEALLGLMCADCGEYVIEWES